MYRVRDAVAEITKVNNEEDDLIKEWANYIDKKLLVVEWVTTDLKAVISPPTTNLPNLSTLFMAIARSKRGTHYIPVENGFIVCNNNCAFLADIMLDGSKCDCGINYLNENGFTFFNGQPCVYLNQYFNQWKENGCQGKVSDYYPKF